MIFTGVTGGEIVSLLYPLFILSPFCYIIISKESLDGAACIDPGRKLVSFSAKEKNRLRSGLSGRHVLSGILWMHDRVWQLHCTGDYHVCGISGGRILWSTVRHGIFHRAGRYPDAFGFSVEASGRRLSDVFCRCHLHCAGTALDKGTGRKTKGRERWKNLSLSPSAKEV